MKDNFHFVLQQNVFSNMHVSFQLWDRAFAHHYKSKQIQDNIIISPHTAFSSKKDTEHPKLLFVSSNLL